MMHIPVRYLVRLLRLFVRILRVFLCWVGDSVAVVEDEFRFGNIPAVMFVNVKGMKELVVR